jgi:uncharacterized protein YgiM (DUF1202 family)
MGIDVGRIANEDRRRANFERNMREQTEALKQQAEAAKRQADAARWQAFNQRSASQQYSGGSSYEGKVIGSAFDGGAKILLVIGIFAAVAAFIMKYWMYIVSVAIAAICLFIIMKIAKRAINPGPKILVTGLVGIALIIIVLVAAPAPKKTQPVRTQTPSAQTTQARYMLVNSDSLNVRSGPSSDHGAVGRLNKNTRVQVLNSSGQWWKIKSGNIEGYVNSSYLIDEKPHSPPSTSSLPQSNFQATHKVITNDGSNLRLRNAQGFNAAHIGSLEYGSYVQVLNTGASAVDSDGYRGNWTYVITPDGRTGWCFGAYLQSNEGNASPVSILSSAEVRLVQFIDPQTEPMHGEPRRLENYVHHGWTGDHKFQDDYEKAVREYDRKRQALPPGLVLPGGKTVQETIDSDPVADK